MRRAMLSPAVRQRLVRLPEPHAAHYGVVPARPPVTGIGLGAAAGRHAAAMTALGEAAEIQRGLPDAYLLSRMLARREAVSSSAMEGTQSTLDELLLLEEGGGASRATEQVRDYARVLEAHLPRFSTEGPGAFGIDEFLRLHRAVMSSDPTHRGIPGALRERVVWIGGGDISTSTFNPPPPGDVPICLEGTAEYLRADLGQLLTQSLLTRMAVAHAHFEAVHPFQDGNGRVGRLLWPLMMAAEGSPPLYLSPYVEANRGAYYEALRQAQQRERWEAIVGFVSDAVVGTVAELKAILADLGTLAEAWRASLVPRKGSAVQRTLPLLAHHPVVTVKRLETLLGVSAPAANAAVARLAAEGILRERTGYDRNRVFVATDVLRVLNRPFGER